MDFLNLAADLASRVDPHLTVPNPRVGCVIVREGKVIATGVHEKFGGSHAEQNALANSSPYEREIGMGFWHDCEVYLTLEPCDCFPGKKTPSCTDLLIEARPKKIIIGALDAKFGGKNVEKIKNAGILVEFRENEKCKALNPFFKKFITTGFPYLTLKIAQSLDGKIINPHGKWITNELSRKRVHEMRANYSAILTTVATILVDDPLLDYRVPTSKSKRLGQSFGVFGTNLKNFSNPQLIILGKKEKIPKSAKIFSIPDRKIHFFEECDLSAVLAECGKRGIDSIMTECGQVMNSELLRNNLVDEILLFIAPKVFGGNVKEAFNCDVDCGRFELVKVGNLDGDMYCKYRKSPSNK